MDFVLARENMVKSQVAPNQVTEVSILKGLMAIPREDFVEEAYQDLAYSDYAVSMGASRRCLKPLQIAKLVQALRVMAGQKILVIGAGTGYEAVLLAKLGASVFALESEESLVARGRQLTTQTSIQWRQGDLQHGWPEEAPFDNILVCGAVAAVPALLLRQLSQDGRVVTILGKDGDAVMDAVRMDSVGGSGPPEVFFQTHAYALPGFSLPSRFEL